MKARDVMTTTVLTVAPSATVPDAVQMMLENRISGLPVVDSAGRLVGIVSEGDFLRRAETGTERKRTRWLSFLVSPGERAADYVQSHARRVESVMTPDPVTVTEDAPLDQVVNKMESHRVKRIPVVRDGRLVGIISRANLLRALASVTMALPAGGQSDADIRQRLLNDLAGQSWWPAGAIDVIVRNGVVDLWGTIVDERTRQALIVAAENVAGVKDVRDHLAWVDPTTGMVFQASTADANRPLES